ncbi:MAG TPA: hypothetical protein VJT33_17035 [bacterium]|nr:hypothetical protein [bacterium]
MIAAVTLAAAWLHPLEPEQNTAGPPIEAQGILVSVDSDAETFVIAGGAGTQEFYVTPDTIIELGRTERIQFRDLANFIGTASLVLSADTGARQDANRVTLLVMPFRDTVPARGRNDSR